MGKVINWEFFKRQYKWYMHKQESVLEYKMQNSQKFGDRESFKKMVMKEN